ncbi:hypothetical protein QAD02_005164 [Eretmocerus hayati]|uniref:Uncharacterized protein n=2 Tax=Eretmocerus hayati TaxID=131215 RepID=A0ACC2NS20_9HYME|nr:hypothetical protein QAD02_005159 [Eretmocerus hayati]KAJ8673902.1 hypothetical protein QAD02_005164 [Eretmocerus hayati]
MLVLRAVTCEENYSQHNQTTPTSENSIDNPKLSSAEVIPVTLQEGHGHILRRKRSHYGKDVLDRDYPFVVALHNSYHQYTCAGSIITRSLVLTASHCIYETQINHVRVLSADGTMEYTHNIHKMVAYPASDRVYYDDIGLLILSIPIQNAQTLPLLPKNYKVTDGRIASAFGWGMTEYGILSTQLRKVDLSVMTSYCMNINPNARHWICTDSRVSDVCQGDSGGPLVYGGYIVGVASHVNGYCRSGTPSVFAEVAAYRDWIDSYTSIYN